MPFYCTKGHENPPGSRFCVQCGEQLVQPGNQGIQAGQMLGGRYRVVRELGHGGFGRTYLAEDLNRFNEHCVLKEFAPQVQGTYALQKAEELFAREAGVLYKLQHPQIPKFREMFRVKQQDKGLLFLVQDYVEGQTYHALLEARKRQGMRFNEAEVTQLMLQLLPVLQYIHSLGVVHRDISPDNLILRNLDGLPVLIDFGGVKQLAATVASQFLAAQGVASSSATRLGKVGYSPPEQMQGGIVFPHSDLYALGATVVVLLTGKEPQQLIDPQTMMWNWRREVNLSPKFDSVLDRMLQPRPSDRFSSAGEVIQALTTTPSPVAYPPTQPPLPQVEPTLAVAPPPVTPPVHQPALPVAETPSSNATVQPSSSWFKTIGLALVSIVVAIGVGWFAGNWWIRSQLKSDDVQPQPTDSNSGVSPTDESTPEPTPQLSPEELRRKEALQQRRVALNIRYNFYAALVNEEFWNQYPNQRGRQLGTGPEDANLRSQWDAIASEKLAQLERLKLSEAARRQLGGYKPADLNRFKADANNLRVSSRSLYDLVDAKFFRAFPQERGKDFLNQPIGQVWQAMVFDTLSALKSGAALERIQFEPGSVNKQVNGTLKPGEGKIFIANLSAGQKMDVKLSTARSALFSIYSPTGQTPPILEDSSDRSWSGQLSESGFYEFVVVSEASKSINYQLDLTVENQTPPESPSESPSASPSESPTDTPTQ
ncbi:MAG TPA: serine/threonine-protein kinase [Allocoleopsis sp.]